MKSGSICFSLKKKKVLKNLPSGICSPDYGSSSPITVTAGLLEPVLVIRILTIGNIGRRNPVSIESSHPSIAERGTHGLI